MGSGASSALLLPPKLSSYDLIEYCRHIDYVNSDMLFKSLKDCNNEVDKSLFLFIANSDAEKEILTFYWSYCAGEMDCAEFLRFCQDAKLLSKKYFTKRDAEELFQSNRMLQNDVINYNVLRFSIFPEIAVRLDCTQSELVEKLSKIDPPDVFENGVENIHSDISKMTPDELIRHRAGLKLQRVWRAGLARRKLKKKRHLRMLHSTSLAELVSSAVYQKHLAETSSENSEDEQNCRRVFDKFSDNSHMNVRGLVQFCFFSGLIPLGGDTTKLDFTRADASHIFDKVIAIHYRPEDRTYAEGVQLGKRVSYHIFRNLIILEIAEKKKMSIDDMLSGIAEETRKRHTCET